MPETQDALSFKQLKAEDNGYVMNFEVENDTAIEDATPFAEVIDTESYTKELRHSPLHY